MKRALKIPANNVTLPAGHSVISHAMAASSPSIKYCKLGRHRAHGFWIRGRKQDRILLDTRLKGRHKLTITLHELLHAVDHKWSESRVTAASRMLSRKLWEAGYRCVDNRRH